MSSSTAGSDVAATPSSSPQVKVEADFSGSKYEIDASLSDEERRFYLKMYPSVDMVNLRKVHCTVCRLHLGTAPVSENNIKMHPILRVSHCVKCHDFYNSGEFSKGEDGSELYCRWCGQGGEVYCCSTCPYVFCKSCIVKNLSKGVITDIEQNENWNCFSCTSKILWPLRAQHWALVNFIQTQKRAIQALPLPELEIRRQMLKDNSNCCRLAKSKTSNMSDSGESLESNVSKRSQGSPAAAPKRTKPSPAPPAKRLKASSNDEVVCTPDLLSMLEPDCQLSTPPKTGGRMPALPTNVTTTPKIITVQQNYTGPTPSSSTGSNGRESGTMPTLSSRNSLPPPLVLSGSGIRYRQNGPSGNNVVRRTVVPNPVRSSGPVFHTINGFRVDLNSAAQQDSYRLPNGRLIQVKRQVPPTQAPPAPSPIGLPPGIVIRPLRPTPSGGGRQSQAQGFGNNIGIYNPQSNQQQRPPQIVRIGSMNPAAAAQQPAQPSNVNGGQPAGHPNQPGPKSSTLVRRIFPDNPVGHARTQLQEQIFSAMEICTHLTGKVVSLTHSNAYNQVRGYMDLKELYIHMSYLMTYAIGRFKNLQEKCLVDMREMGFKNDANSLENGQLAAEKQASDDEDNEIEIVEPKTDTITIDSDNEDSDSTSPKKAQAHSPNKSQMLVKLAQKIQDRRSQPPIKEANQHEKPIMTITSVTSAAPKTEAGETQADIDVAAFSSTILASLLEVDMNGPNSKTKSSATHKKQPRKKTTNKPNPALLQLERKRMEEMKKSDAKLKMKVVVKLRRAEDEFEVARLWAEENKKRQQDSEAENNTDEPLTFEEPVSAMKEASTQSPPSKDPSKSPPTTEDVEDTSKTNDESAITNEKVEEPDEAQVASTEPEDTVILEREENSEDLREKQPENVETIEELSDGKEKTPEKEQDPLPNTNKADETKNNADKQKEHQEIKETENDQIKDSDADSNDLSETENKESKEKSVTPKKKDKCDDVEETPEIEKNVVEKPAVPMETSENVKCGNEEPSADLVESMDTTESLEAPKELMDCGLDDDIGMDGIELSDATEELIQALSRPSPGASENAKDETDLDSNDLMDELPLETAEPPEILLRGEGNDKLGNKVQQEAEDTQTIKDDNGESDVPTPVTDSVDDPLPTATIIG
ncbi:hypothetical protein KR067_011333 [Drosophila pandora]|nr:hypothetical protein KR067_011333 [Drosophila pandora]